MNGFSALPIKVKRRWKEYQARLRNFAVRNKLLPADGAFTRFIILTRSRSGSNFLVDLLNSHEDIVCFNELFSRSGQTFWGVPGHSHQMAKTADVARLKEADPVRFIKEYVYGDHPKHISAVGFKLLYNQAHNGAAKNLWRYLGELDNVRIIHLKRKNLLEVLVSKKRASVDGVWVRRGDDTAAQTSQPPLEVFHEECMTLFAWTREQQKKYDEYFARHAETDLVYEDLMSNTDAVMSEVQGFLGVGQRKLTAHTRKQSTRPLSEVISNYKELKQSFVGTEWESLFE